MKVMKKASGLRNPSPLLMTTVGNIAKRSTISDT